jgi:hypothetical protein
MGQNCSTLLPTLIFHSLVLLVSRGKYFVIVANIVDAFAFLSLSFCSDAIGSALLSFAGVVSCSYERLLGCGEPNAGTSESLIKPKVYSFY